MRQKILVVEDDFKISNIVRIYLTESGFDPTVSDSAASARKSLALGKYSLAILDIGLPDESGEILCQEIRGDYDIPVIFLTSRASEDERIAGFALGADDYVVKPFSPRELVYRAKALLKRSAAASSREVLSFNNAFLLLDESSYSVKLDSKELSITPTEFKILFTLASSPQKVFSREELVSKALGYQFEGYERSVDAHIKNLRQKLNDDAKKGEFIQTVYGAGYRFGGKLD